MENWIEEKKKELKQKTHEAMLSINTQFDDNEIAKYFEACLLEAKREGIKEAISKIQEFGYFDVGQEKAR